MGFIEGSDEIIFNEDNKKPIVKTKRPSYIPLHVAKVMMKIAFCLLRDGDLEDYKKHYQ
ncbi:hypothetical protein ACR79M_13020 [Sphingobacterium spiritivorum]|uniref:hypothetical protein n=1 Tax=Sphingobacterium spiritivorum TaxID=258 RepID=UPI003DA35D13